MCLSSDSIWSLLQPQLEVEEEAEDQPSIATMLAERPF